MRKIPKLKNFWIITENRMTIPFACGIVVRSEIKLSEGVYGWSTVTAN